MKHVVTCAYRPCIKERVRPKINEYQTDSPASSLLYNIGGQRRIQGNNYKETKDLYTATRKQGLRKSTNSRNQDLEIYGFKETRT